MGRRAHAAEHVRGQARLGRVSDPRRRGSAALLSDEELQDRALEKRSELFPF